jgi:uncharacterized membrane protein
VAFFSGRAFDGGMERFWELEPEWIVLWLTILAVLLAILYYVIGKTRPKPVQKEPDASEWLSKYREMNSKGVLTDEEFRTIKTTLAAQLQDELNDSGHEG